MDASHWHRTVAAEDVNANAGGDILRNDGIQGVGHGPQAQDGQIDLADLSEGRLGGCVRRRPHRCEQYEKGHAPRAAGTKHAGSSMPRSIVCAHPVDLSVKLDNRLEF